MRPLNASFCRRFGGVWLVGESKKAVGRGFAFCVLKRRFVTYKNDISHNSTGAAKQRAADDKYSRISHSLDENGKIIVEDSDNLIKDHPDLFKLSVVKTVPDLLDLYQMCRSGYTLNEKIYFLKRIEQLAKGNIKSLTQNPDFMRFVSDIRQDLRKSEKSIQPFATKNFSSFVPAKEEFDAWLDSEHKRFENKKNLPKIGSLALLLKKVECVENDIWELMERHLVNYQFVNGLEEIVNAMEAFSDFRQKIEIQYYKLEAQKTKTWQINPLGGTFIKPPGVGPMPSEKRKPLPNATSSIMLNASEPQENDAVFDEKDTPEALAAKELDKRARRLFRILEHDFIMCVTETNVRTMSRVSDFLLLSSSPNKMTFDTLEYFTKLVIRMPAPCDYEDVWKLYVNFAAAERGSQDLFVDLEHMLLGERTKSTIEQLAYNFWNTPEKLDQLLSTYEKITHRLPDYKLDVKTVINIKSSILAEHRKWTLPQLESCFEKLHLLDVSPAEKSQIEDFLVSSGQKLCQNEAQKAQFLLKTVEKSRGKKQAQLENVAQNGLK